MSLFRLFMLVLCFVGVFVPVHRQATQLATRYRHAALLHGFT
jgi:hypothetical protein